MKSKRKSKKSKSRRKSVRKPRRKSVKKSRRKSKRKSRRKSRRIDGSGDRVPERPENIKDTEYNEKEWEKYGENYSYESYRYLPAKSKYFHCTLHKTTNDCHCKKKAGVQEIGWFTNKYGRKEWRYKGSLKELNDSYTKFCETKHGILRP